MKYLLITLEVQDGERRHTHRNLHTTNAKDIQFAAQRYAASYWGYAEHENDWWWVNWEFAIRVKLVKELSEYEYRLMSELMSETITHTDFYFKIVHAGWNKDSQREEIQIHCGENGNLFLFQDDGKLGFICDVYGQTDHVSTMQVWEEDLIPDCTDLCMCLASGEHLQSCDDDGFCNNCGYQESGIPEESNAPENFSELEVKDFIEKWGQSTNEVCTELGYDEDTCDDLLEVDFFYHERSRRWIPICNSMYSEREQAIADFLKL